ncbi:hypothetical protein TRIP_C30103 [Candidatus Zixiibacteriota bacterium]|nr:hypothetical protein TRIP_C30103 [candidate division Zixibacteria bacterium]
MRTKVKLKKQQIKEDKFTTFMLQSREWLTDNWQVFAIGLAVVVVLIAAGFYYFKMQSDKAQQAGDRLAKAIAELRQQNFQVAILDLKDLADNYSGSVKARAQFDLANAYYDNKSYDDAITQYQKYIDEVHSDPLTTASAMAGVAACLENKQQFLAAGDKFAETVKAFPDSPAEPEYLVGAVRNYVAAGDSQKADSLVTVINSKFPGSDFQLAATRLAMQLQTQ